MPKLFVAATALSALVCANAEAHVVELEIQGTITEPFSGALPSGLDVGDPVYMKLAYESTTPGGGYSGYAFYDEAWISGTVQFGPYAGSLIREESDLHIGNDPLGDFIYAWSWLDIPGWELEDSSPRPYMLFSLEAPPTAWNSTALPGHIPDGLLTDPTTGEMNWVVFSHNEDSSIRYSGAFHIDSVSAVPEPAEWAFMFGGLAFTAFALQRRSSRK